MNRDSRLQKLDTFLLWLLIGELTYTFIFSVIAFFAWHSDALWDIFYDSIRAGVLIPLFFAFLFNMGGALLALISFLFHKDEQKDTFQNIGILFNWIIVAVFSVPYLILLLQISFNILNRVKFFETYF